MWAYILAHWRGRLSLGRSYWFDFVLVNILLAIAVYGVGTLIHDSASLMFSLVYLFSIIAIYTPLAIWQIVGCWRSASRDQTENKRTVLPTLARLSLILGAVGGIGNAGRLLEQAAELTKVVTRQDDTEAYRLSLETDGTELVLSGYINYDSAKEIANYIGNNPRIGILDLISLGGRIGPAMDVARLVEVKGLTTYARGNCVSACTLVFLAGTKRILNQDAHLGFHQPSFPGLNSSDLGQQIADMRAFYLKHGLPGNFVDKALSQSGTAVWYPTQDELIKASVITHIFDNKKMTAVH